MTIGRGADPVLLLDAWAARPVFHLPVRYFKDDEPPNGTPFADRIGQAMPELPWSHNALTTRCGHLLRVHLWLEPQPPTTPSRGGGAILSIEWSTPYSYIELRSDHARAFARPCRRCWPSTPPQT